MEEMSNYRYIRLGLKYNPFPDTGAETYATRLESIVIANVPSYHYIYSTLDGYIQELKRRAISFIVVGDWGSGKTHTLLVFAKKLVEYYGKEKVIVLYIAPTPLSSENDFYSEMSKRLAEELQNIRGLNSEFENVINILTQCANLDCFIRALKEIRQRKDYVIYLALDQLEHDLVPLIRAGRNDIIANISQILETFARKVMELGTGIAIGMSIYSYAATHPAISEVMVKKIFDLYELKSLSLNDVEEFIKAYVKTAYTNKEELIEAGLSMSVVDLIMKLREKYQFYPFDQNSIKALAEVCRPVTPRCVSMYARRAIEIALDEARSDLPILITASHIYKSVDLKYATWSKYLMNWQTNIAWRTFVSAVIKILMKASEEGLIVVLPRRAITKEELQLLNIKEAYELNDNEVLVGLRGEKYVYISRRTSRRIDAEEIKSVISRALSLREKGFDVRKIILISLTNLEPEAQSWTNSARIHNIAFQHVKISQEVNTLGRILFLAENINNQNELERLGLNLRDELNNIVSMLDIR